jgi:hypothetical protein
MKYKHLALVIATLAAVFFINEEFSPPVQRDTTICSKLDEDVENARCIEHTTLTLPARFNPKPNEIRYEGLEIAVAYPSMQPWRSVPWMKRPFTEKIYVQFPEYVPHAVEWHIDLYKSMYRDQLFEHDKSLGLDTWSPPPSRDFYARCPHFGARGDYTCNAKVRKVGASSALLSDTSRTGHPLIFNLKFRRRLLSDWPNLKLATQRLVESFIAP